MASRFRTKIIIISASSREFTPKQIRDHRRKQLMKLREDKQRKFLRKARACLFLIFDTHISPLTHVE